MRAEGLIRKSYFRKLPAKITAFSAKPVLDLTRDHGDDMDSMDIQESGKSYLLTSLIRDAATLQIDGEGDMEFACEYDALLWCAAMIDESPTARSLYAEAGKKGWSIAMGELHNEGFLIDHEEKLVLLDHFSLTPHMLGRSGFFRNVLLTTMIRALRDVWHENRLGDYHRHYAPEDILTIERVRAADCDTVTILCGWELRAAGFTGIWRYLLGAEEGDLAIIFSRHLERDPSSMFNGAALAYAFRQWYADAARVDGVDHDTLEAMDGLIDDADTHNPFGSTRLVSSFIESLSVLPDNIAYLDGFGHGILHKAFYAGLNDAVNRAHLAQMEYDLQVYMVNNVPFRDATLARMIFPQTGQVPVS